MKPLRLSVGHRRDLLRGVQTFPPVGVYNFPSTFDRIKELLVRGDVKQLRLYISTIDLALPYL